MPCIRPRRFCFNAHGVAKYLLSRAVRDAGYKVVITGEGSDEILGGYAHFRRDMLLYNREGQDPDGRGRDARRSWKRLNPVSRGLLLPDGASRTARPRQAAARLRPVMDRDVLGARGEDATSCSRRTSARVLARAKAYGPLLSELDVRGQLAGREPVHQSLYLWSKTAAARATS